MGQATNSWEIESEISSPKSSSPLEKQSRTFYPTFSFANRLKKGRPQLIAPRKERMFAGKVKAWLKTAWHWVCVPFGFDQNRIARCWAKEVSGTMTPERWREFQSWFVADSQRRIRFLKAYQRLSEAGKAGVQRPGAE
jgi:hypothetical protein